MAAIEGIEDDIELGIILLILVVVGVGGYWLYSKISDTVATDSQDTGANNPLFGDTGKDTSTISKVLDNTLSIDSPETKAGYGPTYSQAGLEVISHPIDSLKSIFGIN